jgi:hypothetical protein
MCQGAGVLCRRGQRAFGLPQRHDVGASRADPTVERTGARFTLNFISAVSPRGELRFACCPGTLTTTKFIDFLKRLMVHRGAPVFRVVDGHPVHRSRAVKQFVAST